MTTARNQLVGSTRSIVSYVRVSILGKLINEEVWSVNPVFDPTGELETGIDQAKVDAAAAAIAVRPVPTGLRALLSTQGARTGARVEIRADSDDNLLAISTATSVTPTAGTVGVTSPPQTAAVLSLRTDVPGGSGRGRLYWPGLSVPLDATTGRITTAAQTAFITDFKAYLAGIRTDLATAFPGIAFDLAVRSRTTKTTPHVTRLQAGNVADTQRRRRDAIAESYQTVVFP
jgi:hypothetical protein